MYKLIHRSGMPAVLRWLIYIVLTLTCVYWMIMLFIKLSELLRKLVHFISEPVAWRTFVIVAIGFAIGCLLVAQFCFNLDPFGNFANFIATKWNEFRSFIGGKIGG